MLIYEIVAEAKLQNSLLNNCFLSKGIQHEHRDNLDALRIVLYSDETEFIKQLDKYRDYKYINLGIG